MARLIITRCFKSYDINAHSRGGTPLTVATIFCDEKSLRLLCERADMDADKSDGDGFTPLYYASKSQRERERERERMYGAHEDLARRG